MCPVAAKMSSTRTSAPPSKRGAGSTDGGGEIAPGSDAVGWRIRKNFEGHGWFFGSVTSYNKKIKQYRVNYDDGDSEDLELTDIAKFRWDDTSDTQKPQEEAKKAPSENPLESTDTDVALREGVPAVAAPSERTSGKRGEKPASQPAKKDAEKVVGKEAGKTGSGHWEKENGKRVWVPSSEGANAPSPAQVPAAEQLDRRADSIKNGSVEEAQRAAETPLHKPAPSAGSKAQPTAGKPAESPSEEDAPITLSRPRARPRGKNALESTDSDPALREGEPSTLNPKP